MLMLRSLVSGGGVIMRRRHRRLMLMILMLLLLLLLLLRLTQVHHAGVSIHSRGRMMHVRRWVLLRLLGWLLGLLLRRARDHVRHVR